MKEIIFSFFLISIFVSPIFGESTADYISQDDSLKVKTDTILFVPGSQLKFFANVDDSTNFEKHLIQNPTKALFKSMILPGLGQLGNKKKRKAVIYFGLYAWFLGETFHYGAQAGDFLKQFEETSKDNISLRNDYHSLYLDRKDERNKFRWFTIIVTFISMFDAYSDAHLSGFPKAKENSGLSFDINFHEKQRLSAELTYGF